MEKNDEKLFDVYHGKNNNWQSCISYLRIFATICVIYLHTCSTLSENQELFDLSKMQKIFFNASNDVLGSTGIFYDNGNAVFEKRNAC